jgi:hypothetical protein
MMMVCLSHNLTLPSQEERKKGREGKKKQGGGYPDEHDCQHGLFQATPPNPA